MEGNQMLTPNHATCELEEKWQDVVPTLAHDVEFHPFDKNSYLVQQTKYGFNVRVNTLTYNLLLLVDGIRSLEELTIMLNTISSVQVTIADIHKLLFSGKLSSCGIVETDNDIDTQNKASYLRLRVTIIPNALLQKVSHLFGPVFAPRYFLWSSIVMLLFMAILFVCYESSQQLYNALNPGNIALFWGLMIIGGLLHELGHASACRHFGASHGDIGFGFYLFTPVIYADVSDAWKLDKKSRVIVDMAGVYMEIIICTLFGIAFLITKNMLLLHFGVLRLIAIQANLNPFIRADAYWALSDWLNIPNMRAKSNHIIFQCFDWLFKGKKSPLVDSVSYFLLIYGSVSMVFIVFFVSTMLFLNSHSVLYFPVNIYKFLVSVITEFNEHPFDWFKAEFFKLLLPFFFYMMLYNVLARRGVKWVAKWIRPANSKLLKLSSSLIFVSTLTMISCQDPLVTPAFVLYPTEKLIDPVVIKLDTPLFANVKVKDGLIINVKVGKSFGVSARGDSFNISDLVYVIQGDTASFSYGSSNPHKTYTQIEITLPEIHSVSLIGAAQADVQFDSSAQNISVSLSGASRCRLVGSSLSSLEVTARGASHFDGTLLQSQNAQLLVEDVSEAKVFVSRIIGGNVRRVSKVYYKGMPKLNIQKDELSQIIKLQQ